jgi:tryptophan synthase alpha chain
MGYANTMTRPTRRFAAMARNAGVDGIICVDIPPEEADTLAPFGEVGLDVIRLATPTTDNARLPAVLERRLGLRLLRLGRRDHRPPAGRAGLDRDRRRAAQGRHRPADRRRLRRPHARTGRAIGRVADGVVVGSAIVDLVGKHGEDAPAHVRAYIQSLSAALAVARKEVA